MSARVTRRAALCALLAAATCAGGAPAGLARVTGSAVPGLPRADLVRHARTAAARVEAVLGRAVEPVVVVPGSAAEAARLAGAGSVDGMAALAHAGRVIVVPEAFSLLTAVGRDVVLTHELTHVVAGTAGVPVWLREGFADYVAYRDAGLPVATAAAELAGEVRAGRLPAALPGPEAFAPGSRRLAQAYQEAWLACRLIAARFGEDRLVRLYRDAVEGAAAPALPAAFTAWWRRYVLQELEGETDE
ncbi:hypothetical protein [Thermoactinospora rubra]|uniref:hypothetical protein n=1 Tax=Thermoactinospora rubra TaxID=1088767 RepID=UPI000A116242|nr:hypothetical protein [Thermoactinospora rubra]